MSIRFVKLPLEGYSGQTCLKMIAGFYNVEIPIESIVKKHETVNGEVSFLRLSEAADNLGFRTLGVKINFDLLVNNVPLPCIVKLNLEKFAIVYKIKRDKVWVADPAVGMVKYSMPEFIKSWATTIDQDKPQGLVLIIEPTPTLFNTDHSVVEQLYQQPLATTLEEELDNESEVNKISRLTLVSVDGELKKYLARYPEKIYTLSSRNFEELIADILNDLGFDARLTQATRDGGVDIYAYIRTAVCDLLIFVECKKWSPDNHVGIDVVQRLFGVQQSGEAHKSMIITTSSFTEPAIKEAKLYKGKMELHDFDKLKEWLKLYHNPDVKNKLV